MLTWERPPWRHFLLAVSDPAWVTTLLPAPSPQAAGSAAAAAAPSACATSERRSETWWWGSTPRPSAPPAPSLWEAGGAVS